MTLRLKAVVLTATLMLFAELAAGYTFSSRLIHRFSDEAVSFWTSKGMNVTFPKRQSAEHMRLLLSSDLKRQRLKLGSQKQLLFPSEGSQTHFYGNDLSWLHYAWIDIGTPNVSFLVALDAGSNILWIPCGCVQCAPLTSSYYSMLDKDLNEYIPARSRTSKHLSCSHQLCELGPNCKSAKEHCPYTVSYLSENTSSSGFLFEDKLHLTSVGGHGRQGSVLAPIIIGCGSKQSGSYLDGAAPDGVMGLGPGEISVPSLLAESGFITHSFSLCFGKSNSGTIFFGDQGPEDQRLSSFISLNGIYDTYVVEVQHYCVGDSCLKQSGFQALVDSGSSFTYLPSGIFTRFATEFDDQMNATRSASENFRYCYKTSKQGLPNIPSMKLVLAANESFVIQNPIFTIFNGQGDNVICLGILPIEGTVGIIGQNLMEGYLMVFDWENMRLGWSHSKCQDISRNAKVSPTPPPSGLTSNPLPTNEQQRNPGGHAVAPAIAGKATLKPSAASSLDAISCWHFTISSLLLSLIVRLPNLI